MKALAPARVREVRIHPDTGTAEVIVPDFQLSLAIGKEGQNARLAARLTGWRVDIKSETQLAEEESGGGVEYAEGEWVTNDSGELVWQPAEGGEAISAAEAGYAAPEGRRRRATRRGRRRRGRRRRRAAADAPAAEAAAPERCGCRGAAPATGRGGGRRAAAPEPVPVESTEGSDGSVARRAAPASGAGGSRRSRSWFGCDGRPAGSSSGRGPGRGAWLCRDRSRWRASTEAARRAGRGPGTAGAGDAAAIVGRATCDTGGENRAKCASTQREGQQKARAAWPRRRSGSTSWRESSASRTRWCSISCERLKIGVKSHSSSIDDPLADRVRRLADSEGLRREPDRRGARGRGAARREGGAARPRRPRRPPSRRRRAGAASPRPQPVRAVLDPWPRTSTLAPAAEVELEPAPRAEPRRTAWCAPPASSPIPTPRAPPGAGARHRSSGPRPPTAGAAAPRRQRPLRRRLRPRRRARRRSS